MEVEPREDTFSALLLSACLAAAIIVIALQRPGIIVIVLPVVTVVALVVGLPLYVAVASRGWVSPFTAAIAGAITGAAIPASLLLLAFELEAFRLIGMFALLGAVMGLAFLFILQRRTASRPAQRRTVALAAVLALAGIAMFQFGFDHSCHNPGIRGALARYPGMSFTVSIPQSEWPKLRDEVERFGRERGWSALRGFDGRDSVEICTLPATLIYAKLLDGEGAQTRYSVSTEEPLHDNADFRAEFRRLLSLQYRIAARWPGAIRDEEIAALRFIASPDGKPSPAPSSTAR